MEPLEALLCVVLLAGTLGLFAALIRCGTAMTPRDRQLGAVLYSGSLVSYVVAVCLLLPGVD